MKNVKFTAELAQLIISGEKTSTWRLFDDKNLSLGDDLEFVNSDTGEKFGEARIIEVKEKPLGSVEQEDFEGHETYKDDEEMYATYRKYYGDKVGPETLVKIIKFDFRPTLSK
jgi:hypothetical protein